MRVGTSNEIRKTLGDVSLSTKVEILRKLGREQRLLVGVRGLASWCLS